VPCHHLQVWTCPLDHAHICSGGRWILRAVFLKLPRSPCGFLTALRSVTRRLGAGPQWAHCLIKATQRLCLPSGLPYICFYIFHQARLGCGRWLRCGPCTGGLPRVSWLLAQKNHSREQKLSPWIVWRGSRSVPLLRDRDWLSRSGEFVLVSVSPLRSSQVVFCRGTKSHVNIEVIVIVKQFTRTFYLLLSSNPQANSMVRKFNT
jgi:hypothetical protein